MNCTQCGTLATTDAKFCAKCGNPISKTPPEKPIEPPAVPVVVKKPKALWLYIVGFILFCTVAAMFLSTFIGSNIFQQLACASMFWTGLFFYLWWKRRARKGWHGLLIGFAIGIFVSLIVACISGVILLAMRFFH